MVFQKLFETFRKEILGAKLLMVEGRLQREGEVVHVIVKRCFDLSKLLRGLTLAENENLPLLSLSRADEKTPFTAENKRTQVREIVQEGFSQKQEISNEKTTKNRHFIKKPLLHFSETSTP